LTCKAGFPQLIFAEPVLTSSSASLKMGQLESVQHKPCTNMNRFLPRGVSTMATSLPVPMSFLRIPLGVSLREEVLRPLTLRGVAEQEREIPQFDYSHAATQIRRSVTCD